MGKTIELENEVERYEDTIECPNCKCQAEQVDSSKEEINSDRWNCNRSYACCCRAFVCKSCNARIVARAFPPEFEPDDWDSELGEADDE